MSKDKYAITLSPLKETIVFIIPLMSFAIENREMSVGYSPVFTEKHSARRRIQI